MYQYFYKKFKVEYEITFNSKLNVFEAHAKIICLINKNNPPQEFSTEAFTRVKTRSEIKKLIKNYIDFEWQQMGEKNIEF
jgi:hypothetical protein